VKYCRIKKYQ
jgi:hypothetical protein